MCSTSGSLRIQAFRPAGLEGGVVAASRSILYPDAGATDNAGRWEAAFDEGLGMAIEELGVAVSQG